MDDGIEGFRTGKEWLQEYFESTVDAAFLIDDGGIIQAVNRSACALFGYGPEELLDRNIKMLTPPSIRKHHDGFLKAYDPDKPVGHILGDDRVLMAVRADGTKFPVEVGISSYREDGRRYFIGMVRDQTEKRESLRKITYLATHDTLTDLPNRASLLEQIELAAFEALIILNIDGFKSLNRRLGATAGDEILIDAARRIEDAAPEDGSVARLTADQFAVGLRDAENLDAICGRLCEALKAPFSAGGMPVGVSWRLGASRGERCDDCALTLLARAETALDQARNLAGEKIALFDADFLRRNERSSKLTDALTDAITRDEFRLVFQPKVDRATHRITGAEALLRWTSPDLGVVSPAEFIPEAERSGQIARIDRWVFEQGLAFLAEMAGQGADDFVLALNLSASNLYDASLADWMGALFDRHGIAPDRVQVEITESAVSEDMTTAVRTLHLIRGLGCSIAVDDFGTGYSSLSYLTDLPIRVLKVDQSFMRRIPGDTKTETVVRSILKLSEGLDLQTIVEGVETEEQLSFLATYPVDYIQGYLFSPPMERDAFKAKLLSGEREIRL